MRCREIKASRLWTIRGFKSEVTGKRLVTDWKLQKLIKGIKYEQDTNPGTNPSAITFTGSYWAWASTDLD